MSKHSGGKEKDHIDDQYPTSSDDDGKGGDHDDETEEEEEEANTNVSGKSEDELDGDGKETTEKENGDNNNKENNSNAKKPPDNQTNATVGTGMGREGGGHHAMIGREDSGNNNTTNSNRGTHDNKAAHGQTTDTPHTAGASGASSIATGQHTPRSNTVVHCTGGPFSNPAGTRASTVGWWTAPPKRYQKNGRFRT